MDKSAKRLRPGLLRIAVALTLFVAAFVFCTVYFRNNIVPTVMGSAVAEVRALPGITVVRSAESHALQDVVARLAHERH